MEGLSPLHAQICPLLSESLCLEFPLLAFCSHFIQAVGQKVTSWILALHISSSFLLLLPCQVGAVLPGVVQVGAAEAHLETRLCCCCAWRVIACLSCLPSAREHCFS